MSFDIYEDATGLWRWRLVNRGGLIVADSAESYSTKSNAVRAVRRVFDAMRDEVERP